MAKIEENALIWGDAIRLCVEEHYRSLLSYMVKNNKNPAPGSWRETLCWACMLRWNASNDGLVAAFERSLPHKPSCAEVITRFRDYGMPTLANTLHSILQKLPNYPSYFEGLSELDNQYLSLPLKESLLELQKEPEKGFFYCLAIDRDNLTDDERELFNVYQSLRGQGVLYEIYNFLCGEKRCNPEELIICDLIDWKNRLQDGSLI